MSSADNLLASVRNSNSMRRMSILLAAGKMICRFTESSCIETGCFASVEFRVTLNCREKQSGT